MNDQKQIVLLVEDDEVYRESIHRLLDSEYELHSAATGQEALTRLQSTNPNCVLLDFRLPDYSGLQLLPKFLERESAVVMLTAEGSEQVAVEALKLGCHDYLVKRDLTKELLTRAVYNAISRNDLQRQLEIQRRELESFVATAAHDLKGPLRAIQGFSQIAETAIESGQLDKLPEYLRTVQKSAGRLAGMVDALLEYTRLDGKRRCHESVDLNASVELLATEFESTLDEVGGKLEAESLPLIHGDPQLLLQLLQNLIANALKFQRDTPPVVKIDAQQVDEEWIISVADNGIGIDPRQCSEIFKPLRRLHSEKEFAGYGIGLATCQRIVEKHSGRIWVKSEPGQGATFYFALPCEQEKA